MVDISVSYGNVDPFSGLAPVPLIERNDEFLRSNHRQGLVTSLSLQGQITGECLGGFSGLYDRAQTLVSRFATNFQSLEITEGIDTIFSRNSVVVRSIEFGESSYNRILPFTINIDCFNDVNDAASFVYDDLYVIDPVDEFTFTENEDKTVTIQHKVGAKGLNTDPSSADALQNAKNFVAAHSGWNSQVLPHFIDSPSDVIFMTAEEQANRLQGEYSITESYVYDPKMIAGSGNLYTLRYECDYDRDEKGATVKIAGTLYAGKDGSIGSIQSSFSSFDLFAAAEAFYNSVDSGVLMNQKIAGSIVENPFKKEITFDFTYSDNPEDANAVKTIDKIVVNQNYQEQTLCASLDMRFEANNRKCHTVAWQEVQDEFAAFDPYGYLIEKLAGYGFSTDLDSTYKSISYGEDPFNKTIDASYEFCRDDLDLHRCFENLDYTITIAPAIPMYAPKAVLDGAGRYIVQELGYDRRASYSLQGTTTISECCSLEEGVFALKSWMNEVQGEYFVGNRKIIESEVINTGNSAKIVSFSATWSAEAGRTLDEVLF